MRTGDKWKQHIARVDETARAGIRAYPMCSPNRVTQDFTMKNCQVFRGLPTWHPILISSDADKMRAYADPQVRDKLHAEAVERSVPISGAIGFSKTWWDYMWVNEPALEKNKPLQFKTIGEIAKDAEQAGDRRVPGPGGRGEVGDALPPGREQHRRRGGQADPDLSERVHRVGRRRRARAVPRRLWLHHAAARRMGAREACDDAGAGGEAAHLRSPRRCSASAIAACCARVWRRTS